MCRFKALEAPGKEGKNLSRLPKVTPESADIVLMSNFLCETEYLVQELSQI